MTNKLYLNARIKEYKNQKKSHNQEKENKQNASNKLSRYLVSSNKSNFLKNCNLDSEKPEQRLSNFGKLYS